MKKQRKFTAVIVMLNVFVCTIFLPIVVKAKQDYIRTSQIVDKSISERDFYHYNLAYKMIMELPAGYERDLFLSKLNSIADTVWTKDILDIVHLFEIMAKEKNIQAFYTLETRINKANLKEVDKQYLLTELNTWCKDIIHKEDYEKHSELTNEMKKAFRGVEKYLRALKPFINKEFLAELIYDSKQAFAAAPEILNEKYFNGINTAYIGEGNSISLDLSRDTLSRTVILKGKFDDLYINVPKGTVILEDVEAKNLILLDVENNSLLMRGKTIVETFIVRDRNNDANIIIEENTTISSVEIKSGVTIEVNTGKEVSKPFGEFRLNLHEIRGVKLKGSFKESSVSLERPVNLKIEGSIKKINVSEDAKNSNISISEQAKVEEIQTEAFIKIQGSGFLGTITGSGSRQVENTLSYVSEKGNAGTENGGSDNTDIEEKLQIRISWDLQGEDVIPKVFNSVLAGDVNTVIFYSLPVEGVSKPSNIIFVIDCQSNSGNSKGTIEIMDDSASLINGLWHLPAKDGFQQSVKIKFIETGQYNLTIYAVTK